MGESKSRTAVVQKEVLTEKQIMHRLNQQVKKSKIFSKVKLNKLPKEFSNIEKR